MRLSPLAFIALAACGPAEAPLCPPVQVACPVMVERDWLWREVPPDLAPGEIVVDAALEDMTPGVISSPSTGWRSGLFGEEAFACTEQTPVSLNRYRVISVAAGDFAGAHFTLVNYPPGCAGTASPAFDPTAPDRAHARRIGHEGPLYMIVRPGVAPDGLDAAIAPSAPVMTAR